MLDEMVFVDDEPAPAWNTARPWQVMVVDDEVSIHQVTRLVMSDFELDGRRLQIIDCYSAEEAKQVLQREQDIALILLDVVMEREHAGLELVHYIRHDLGNSKTRIVLRTGQAGQAPQEQVIRDYDINDYKEKIELTHAKLLTIFYASLRAYRDLQQLETSRAGLLRTLGAITEIADAQSLHGFACSVRQQLDVMLEGRGDVNCVRDLCVCIKSVREPEFRIMVMTPAREDLCVEHGMENLPEEMRHALHETWQRKRSHFGPLHFVTYRRSRAGSEGLLYVALASAPGECDEDLLEQFSGHVLMTYDKLMQKQAPVAQ